MSVYRIDFRAEKCLQCYACESACKIWREVEPGIKWRKMEKEWRGSYPEVRSRALTSACRHCGEPACLDACPYNVPEFGADGTMQKCDLCFGLRDRVSTQICVANCPVKALRIVEN